MACFVNRTVPDHFGNTMSSTCIDPERHGLGVNAMILVDFFVW